MGRKYGGNLTRQFGLYVLRVLEPMRLTMDIESHIGLRRIGPVIVMYSVFVNYGGHFICLLKTEHEDA